MGSLNQSSSQVAHLVTATAAKIDMEPRRANMNGATPVAMAVTMAGAVPGTMPVAVAVTMTGAMPGTMPVAVAVTMTGAVPGTMPVAVVVTMTGAMASAMTVTMARTVPIAVAGTMTGAMPVAMTGMMISSPQCGGSENGEACGNRQDGDDPFHIELFLSLSFCSQKAVCKTDEVLSRLFI
jgi:hypothetical protein